MLLNRNNSLEKIEPRDKEELNQEQLATVSAGHDGTGDIPYQLLPRDNEEELTDNQLTTVVEGHDEMGNLPYQLLHPNADKLEVEDLTGRKLS